MEPAVMMRLSSSLPFALGLLLLAGGCDEEPETRVSMRTGGLEGEPHMGLGPSSAAAFEQATGQAAAPEGTRGTVLETMNAAGYTYLRIETPGGGSTWVAAMEMPLAVGDQVVVEGGNEMVDFHSRTLDRTFPSILFAGSVRVVGGGEGVHEEGSSGSLPAGHPPTGEMPPGHPPTGEVPPGHPPTGEMPAGHPPTGEAGEVPPGHAAAAEAPASPGARGVVRETMNAGGYTYLRIEGASGSVWVAVPEMTVAVGDQVEAEAGAEMPGFHSSTLDRTFEQITFSSGARVIQH
ncbi:MAG: hypothetical protein U0353_10195 [Sandaracinus sp.]